MQNRFKERLSTHADYIEFLEAYGRDWFAFIPHRKFYTQATWLAFKAIVVSTILGKPLTKGEAEAAFKTNGEALLQLAIKEGLVRKNRQEKIRVVLIEASDELIANWLDHIDRTHNDLRQKLAGENR